MNIWHNKAPESLDEPKTAAAFAAKAVGKGHTGSALVGVTIATTSIISTTYYYHYSGTHWGQH